MSGPVALGVVGAVIVLLALVWSASMRPHISSATVRSGGVLSMGLRDDNIAHSPGLRTLAKYVNAQGNATALAAFGSALQLVALLWQAAS
jgi:hypothetical protein